MNIDIDPADPSLTLKPWGKKAQAEIIRQRADIIIDRINRGHSIDSDVLALCQAAHMLYRTIDLSERHSRTRFRDAFQYAAISPSPAIRFGDDHLVELGGTFAMNALGKYVQW